jgi:hypothetical protein
MDHGPACGQTGSHDPRTNSASASQEFGESHERENATPQLDKLRATGCDTAREEHASGADRILPVLARLLREIGPGKPWS